MDGWDSACKGAALANVLMDARLTPQQVERRGIGKWHPTSMAGIKASGRNSGAREPPTSRPAGRGAGAQRCCVARTCWPPCAVHRICSFHKPIYDRPARCVYAGAGAGTNRLRPVL
ncbi:MAG: hypothetical protein IPP47_00605 [Bryobacterales bacterium]|nr:hypothetical protein [Bryobacterales bacterium]